MASFQWMREADARLLAWWAYRWERVRRGGRERYIWIRVIPICAISELFLSITLPAIVHRRHLEISDFFHYPSLVGMVVVVFLGYLHGYRQWKKCEDKYVEWIRVHDREPPTQ